MKGKSLRRQRAAKTKRPTCQVYFSLMTSVGIANRHRKARPSPQWNLRPSPWSRVARARRLKSFNETSSSRYASGSVCPAVRRALSNLHCAIIVASHRCRVRRAMAGPPARGGTTMRRPEYLTIAAIIGSIGLSSVACADDDSRRDLDFKHVLLISIDGMHASDLANYTAKHPQSSLARLAAHGFIYPKALTTAPSDSFPGLLAQVTGGTPKSAGVFYDSSYDRTMFAPGSDCTGPAGVNTLFDESIDNDTASVTGGGTLGQPLTQINPAKLPRALVNGTCVPVYPHSFVKVNTIFEVIHGRGLRTAWADKHPAYDLVNGPSGKGVDDLFTPEVDSNDTVTGQDTTLGFHSVQRNDMLKVKAILNEIAGFDSTGVKKVGVPAIFGMNFQAVSVGEKLAVGNPNDVSDQGLTGGYADVAGAVPNNGLQSALDFVDQQIGAMVSALQVAHLEEQTLVIISAKHGQSPINRALRVAFDDAPYGNTPGIGQFTTDDVGLVWLA